MNAQFGWAGWLVLASAVGIAGTVSCSGASFCGDSRTCAAPAADGGAAGAPVGETAGTAGSSQLQQGGQGGQNELGDGGAAGQPVVSTVGNACSKDPECDDRDSCTGVETCVDGACAAGKAVKCDVGMKCSAAKNDACVWSSDAPWIVYIADDDTTGVNEAYGVKSDLVGKMKPIKLSPVLEAGARVTDISTWSPDGTMVVMSTSNAADTQADAYLVHFGDGTPDAPIPLTKGMPTSKTSVVQWSPTGKSVGISRDDGFYVVDYAAAGGATHQKASADNTDVFQAWMNSDDELIYAAHSVLSMKSSIGLATRAGAAWTKTPLVSDIDLFLAQPSPDHSLVAYLVDAGNNLRTFWAVEATAGSKPVKVIGPDYLIDPAISLNAKWFVMATTATTASTESTVYAGPLAMLTTPPLLKAHVALSTLDILDAQTFPLPDLWAPDSSRSVLFQPGAFGKQLVMYEPGATTEWLPLSVNQAGLNQGAPVWSPDSRYVALPTRTSASSLQALTLVSSPDYATHDVDTAPAAGYIGAPGFTSGGEFVAYSKSADRQTYNLQYVDLRGGAASFGAPAALPGPGARPSFASQGTALVYVRGQQTCEYVDLAEKAVPAQVNGKGTAASCSFQKLPP